MDEWLSGWGHQGDDHAVRRGKKSQWALDLYYFVVNLDRDRSLQDKIKLAPNFPLSQDGFGKSIN